MSNETPEGHDPAINDISSVGGKVAPKATRFLFAGYTALALAAVVLSWQRAPGTLIPVAISVILLSTAVVLLARAVSNNPTVAAKTLLWTVLSGIIALGSLFISSAFFGMPERGAVIAARLLDAPKIALARHSPEALVVGPDSAGWPSDVQGVLDVSGDRFDRVQALSHRPSVVISGTTIVSSGAAVALNVLDLQNGTIVTNGSDLTIEAVKVKSGGGSIRSFGSVPQALPGQPGRPGGKVTLIVHDLIAGRLSVDLAGSPGGGGSSGQPGAAGANGGPGDNSSQTAFGCSHGGGTGGAGQAGGHGGNGEAGAQGGDGGTLVVYATDPDLFLRSIGFTAKGGAGGSGGSGGQGGPGGRGGPGGHGGGYCGGGQGGPDGPQGEAGQAGPTGSPGKEGPQPIVQELAKTP